MRVEIERGGSEGESGAHSNLIAGKFWSLSTDSSEDEEELFSPATTSPSTISATTYFWCYLTPEEDC
jgi:hypothetical protein